MVDWSIEAVTFGSCNCDYNCPCQFELRPTHGNCRGFEIGRVERGHYGDVQLDGLGYAVVYAWPSAIFEGNGEMQAIVDERADPDQRTALLAVLAGEDTEPAKTHWWVFRTMSSKVHDPVFAPVELEVDIDRRIGRAVVPGILEASGRPIRSPATGDEHRVRIAIPHGIEFDVAEIGSATTRATGAITLELNDTYGQFNRLHHTGQGPVRGEPSGSAGRRERQPRKR